VGASAALKVAENAALELVDVLYARVQRVSRRPLATDAAGAEHDDRPPLCGLANGPEPLREIMKMRKLEVQGAPESPLLYLERVPGVDQQDIAPLVHPALELRGGEVPPGPDQRIR